MAKQKEKVELKKGEARFTLVGKALVNDYTFKIDEQSKNSNWVYNSLKLGVDCGEDGTVFAEMMGGFDSKKGGIVYVHGKKQNDKGNTVDDYGTRWEIDWEDRLDESLFDEIGDNCFITVGIEKNDKDKTFYKKFLSEYDAVQYMSEHLENDMVVRVQGSLSYSEYEEKTQVKKQITSVVLSNVEEEGFGATFTQSILVDSSSVDKLDKDRNTYTINARVVDYVGNVKIDGKKVKIGKSATYVRRFELEHKGEKTEKLIKMLFGAKKDSVWEVVVEGSISKGGKLVTMTEDDLPEDIKELIEYEVMTVEEAIEKCVGKGGKIDNYIIKKPKVKRIENDGEVSMAIELTKDKCTVDDYVTYSQLLEGAGITVESNDNEPEVGVEAEIDINELLNQL